MTVRLRTPEPIELLSLRFTAEEVLADSCAELRVAVVSDPNRNPVRYKDRAYQLVCLGFIVERLGSGRAVQGTVSYEQTIEKALGNHRLDLRQDYSLDRGWKLGADAGWSATGPSLRGGVEKRSDSTRGWTVEETVNVVEGIIGVAGLDGSTVRWELVFEHPVDYEVARAYPQAQVSGSLESLSPEQRISLIDAVSEHLNRYVLQDEFRAELEDVDNPEASRLRASVRREHIQPILVDARVLRLWREQLGSRSYYVRKAVEKKTYLDAWNDEAESRRIGIDDRLMRDRYPDGLSMVMPLEPD